MNDVIRDWHPWDSATFHQSKPRQLTQQIAARISQVAGGAISKAEEFGSQAITRAEKFGSKAATAVGKAVNDMRLISVPKLASLLGLSFFWTPGVLSTLLNSALITIFIQGCGFIAHEMTGRPHHYDLLGATNAAAICLYSLYLQPVWGLRQFILTGMVCLWAMRLTTFLVDRIRDEGPDRVLEKLKTRRQRAIVWCLQGLFAFISVLPVLFVNSQRGDLPLKYGRFSIRNLTSYDFVGFALWTLGFFWETIADFEKAKFRKRPLKENDKPFIDSGLWRYSRHPNYFGEILMWTGIYLSAFSVLHGWQNIAILSPLFVSFILRFVSGVPRTEAQSDRAFEKLESYQSYKARTPTIIPFL